MKAEPVTIAEFDGYAEEYEASLAQGLSISGEDQTYFARGRVEWLKQCLDLIEQRPRSLMDFGCGIGFTSAMLSELIGESVVGLDTSRRILDQARRRCASDRCRFISAADYEPAGDMDLVFCSGVFHHIPRHERSTALSYIYRSLRPGGIFAFWENNPWNPGTRYIMSKIPFDRNAVMVSAPTGRRLMMAAGFEIIRMDFLFLFPRMLKWLRWIETSACRIPCGAQFQILGRKPPTHEPMREHAAP